LGFEREKIVLNRTSSCCLFLLFVFCFKRKVVVMNEVERALENIANGARVVWIRSFRLDLERLRRLIAACCDASSKVRKVQLTYCGLDAEAAELIVSSLRSNSVLTELNLGNNKDIGPQGAQALAEILCVSTALKTLILYWCKVGDEGAGHLAVALRRNRTLEELGLGGNGITHVGAAAFVASLLLNETLKCLQLYCNPLGDDGVEVLAKAVPRSGLRAVAV
jgi:hypothetical protein